MIEWSMLASPKGYWTTRDGQVVLIARMHDKHLLNAVWHLMRKAQEHGIVVQMFRSPKWRELNEELMRRKLTGPSYEELEAEKGEEPEDEKGSDPDPIQSERFSNLETEDK